MSFKQTLSAKGSNEFTLKDAKGKRYVAIKIPGTGTETKVDGHLWEANS
jgi:hypothetical protein